MNTWRTKLLESNVDLTNQQINILLNGPNSLAESCILQALKFKYFIQKQK